MRTLPSVSVLALLILGGAHAGDEALQKKELEALRGRWNVPKTENDGDVQTQCAMVENSLQISIGGNTIDFRFTVDPAKKPKEITLTTMLPDGSDRSMLGIYQLEGDMLKLCFGEKRPTSFKTHAGSKQSMWVLKRQKQRGGQKSTGS